MGMMKGNMMMMVPQTVIMGWINAFFAGFVISMSAVSTLGWKGRVDGDGRTDELTFVQ